MKWPITRQSVGVSPRRMRSGHHLVFYLVTSEAVEVVRILHNRKDVDTLLG